MAHVNQWAGIYESSVDSDRSRLIRLPDDDDDAVDDERRPLSAPPAPAGHRASASDSDSEQPPSRSPAIVRFVNPASTTLPGGSSLHGRTPSVRLAVYAAGRLGGVPTCITRTSLDILYLTYVV